MEGKGEERVSTNREKSGKDRIWKVFQIRASHLYDKGWVYKSMVVYYEDLCSPDLFYSEERVEFRDATASKLRKVIAGI